MSRSIPNKYDLKGSFSAFYRPKDSDSPFQIYFEIKDEKLNSIGYVMYDFTIRGDPQWVHHQTILLNNHQYPAKVDIRLEAVGEELGLLFLDGYIEETKEELFALDLDFRSGDAFYDA